VSLNLIVVVLYFVILLVIGAVASQRIKTKEDYIVGGRNVGFWVFVLLIISSCTSGMSILGTSGLGFIGGWPTIWEQIFVPLTTAVCILLYGTKIFRISQKKTYLTIEDYFCHRFYSKKSIRSLSAFAVITVSVIYLTGQYKAIGLVLSWLLKIPESQAILFGGIIVMAYVLLGGLYAVAWASLFQGLIILVGIVAVAPFIIIKAGGMTHVNTVLASLDPNYVKVAFPQVYPPAKPYMVFTPAYLTSLGLLLGLGLGSAPHIINNVLTVKKSEYYKWAPLAAFGLYVIVMYLIKMVGFSARVMAEEGHIFLPNVPNKTDYAFVEAIQYTMPEIVWPLFVVIVLAAVLSTTDRLMLTIGTSFSWNIFKNLIYPKASDKTINWVSRISIIVITAGTMWAAMNPFQLLFWLIWTGIGVILSTFVAPLLFGLYWRRATKEGALAGMGGGLIAALFFAYYDKFHQSLPVHFSLFGFLVSILLVVGVSLVTKPTPEDVLNETETGFYI